MKTSSASLTLHDAREGSRLVSLDMQLGAGQSITITLSVPVGQQRQYPDEIQDELLARAADLLVRIRAREGSRTG